MHIAHIFTSLTALWFPVPCLELHSPGQDLWRRSDNTSYLALDLHKWVCAEASWVLIVGMGNLYYCSFTKNVIQSLPWLVRLVHLNGSVN